VPEKYGGIADFVAGDQTAVPRCDVILASNVTEHLTDDEGVVAALQKRCRASASWCPTQSPLREEHLRAYTETKQFEARSRVFASRAGLSLAGARLAISPSKR
jgi:hypothetical protein